MQVKPHSLIHEGNKRKHGRGGIKGKLKKNLEIITKYNL